METPPHPFPGYWKVSRRVAELCGFKPEVRGTSNTPEGVFARGGDTAKQLAMGLRYTIDFRAGVQRALEYYERGTTKK